MVTLLVSSHWYSGRESKECYEASITCLDFSIQSFLPGLFFSLPFLFCSMTKTMPPFLKCHSTLFKVRIPTPSCTRDKKDETIKKNWELESSSKFKVYFSFFGEFQSSSATCHLEWLWGFCANGNMSYDVNAIKPVPPLRQMKCHSSNECTVLTDKAVQAAAGQRRTDYDDLGNTASAATSKASLTHNSVVSSVNHIKIQKLSRHGLLYYAYVA